MQSKRKGFDRSKFKVSEAGGVELPRGELVKSGFLRDGVGLPRVLEPGVGEVDLADWLQGNRDHVIGELESAGAVLFRGFRIDTPERLERVAGTLCSELFNENGEHPRDSVSGNVYTPVFYPPEKQLLWHNENSFNPQWPKRIFFACATPPGRGGETPLVDSREVYRRIDPEIRELFERKGVMYMRNYAPGLGLQWWRVFQSRDRAEVEEICGRGGFAVEWKEGDRLKTTCVRPAVIRHPDTGEACWFNQAQHWHVSCLEPEVRESLTASFAEDDLPRNCYFGDGSTIPDAAMDRVLSVYRDLEVSFPWQRGDVVLVDNILAAHGRNPFEGPRKILVAMGDMTRYEEVQ
jgi:alpha-ketoglutarate-dependent taurine dioxygenase